ncbi:hypothetical protein [Cryptosporangium phraense]|uniref:Uncharacterized protein n=1 Tax=Cryptosporangium phraense TaxID=2593070 RepID=A0A545AMB4_9ACTN|nr:hypothetical protein [Cryptosporangium phraense]TQS42479.1 hypothetical protein FL583_24575 [Cryptosporangium phraense]
MPVAPPNEETEGPRGRAIVPIRAIGIAGDETRVASATFGARELAWSPYPNRSFDSAEPPHGDNNDG